MQTITAQFSGTKEQHILTASGSLLTLLRAHPTLGTVETLVSYDVLSIIRSVALFRPAGSARDYIIVATDSGRIAILEYLATENRFSRILLESFGRSGVRRLVPGQYVAADPKGRACMIASIEKNKLVYVLIRDSQVELTMSSPLETEDGDIFKVTLDMQESEGSLKREAWRIKIKYFDPIPVASSLSILKSGFLFLAAEFGSHRFYQFEKLGDEDEEPEFTSDKFPTDSLAFYEPIYFRPRLLENLILVQDIDSLSPLLDLKVEFNGKRCATNSFSMWQWCKEPLSGARA
ncbi:pre-mRNA-splicing factor rse1 [Neonectria punicea]|uniref:Pre-mRNA-splicing factor rse1 n=1 Tax=Neonectria punicea TaxID=979145 RepID=A0ABR1GTK0_9HYPO